MLIVINNMIYRNNDGKLIEIKRLSYNTDLEYYKEIMKIKGYTKVSKDDTSMKRVLSVIKIK